MRHKIDLPAPSHVLLRACTVIISFANFILGGDPEYKEYKVEIRQCMSLVVCIKAII